MLDLTKPVQTMDGRKARIICTNAMIMHTGEEQRNIVALVTGHNSEIEQAYLYFSNGKIIKDSHTYNDLKNVPIKVTRHIIVYKHMDRYQSSNFMNDLIQANNSLCLYPPGAKIVEVTWEE